MAYSLPGNVRNLQAKVRHFVNDVAIPRELESEEDEEAGSRNRERALEFGKANGLMAMSIPKEFGGGGLSYLEQAVVSEEAGRATNSLGKCFTTPARFLVDVASAYQMETWVKPLIKNERSYAYLITEEDAGSDVDAIEATAVPRGEGYLLNGVKWHATGGLKADFFIFQAKFGDGPRKGEHALFFVDKADDGVQLTRVPKYMHSHLAHPIFAFKNVFVPAVNLLNPTADAMKLTREWFRFERLMIAAHSCGAAARLIDEATAFAKERVAYGKPISKYQAIQFMLADSLTELWAARLMTYQTATAMDNQEDIKTLHAQCAMAKLYASEMAGRIADRALQIFGGRGYMSENVANRLFREVRIDRIWEGTSEIQRIIIAGGLFKRGQDTLAG